MKTKDIMTSAPVTIRPGATVAEAAKAMLEAGVSGLPVVEADGTLAGMLTEGDLVRRSEYGAAKRPSWWLRLISDDRSLAADYARAHGRYVREAMSRSVVAVEEETPVARVAELLASLGVKRLPVVRDGRLVGIVARRDLLKALIAAPPPAGEAPGDAAIAAAIRAALSRETWIDAAQVVLTVAQGAVTLAGRVSAESQHQALLALVENQPGVLSVDDRISVGAWPV